MVKFSNMTLGNRTLPLDQEDVAFVACLVRCERLLSPEIHIAQLAKERLVHCDRNQWGFGVKSQKHL